MIILKTKIKRPVNVKFNPICYHPFEKKWLDNILPDAYEYITTKKIVKNIFVIFDYSKLPWPKKINAFIILLKPVILFT